MLLLESVTGKPIFEDVKNEELSSGVLFRVTYPICNLGERNANNRVYEKAVFVKVIGDDSIREKLENRNLFGQAEHPAETQSDLQLTSHVIHKMWIDENTVYQTLDIVDTPPGRIVDALFRAKCPPGMSTRAEGDIEEAEDDEGTYHRIIPESYNYVTTDFTADPSTYSTLPIDVKRNMVSSVAKEAANTEAKEPERKFAQQLLESMKCEDKSKCQHCGCCDEAEEEKEVKEELPKTQTMEDLIKNELVKAGALVEFKTGEHKGKKGKVEKIEEGSVSVSVGEELGKLVGVAIHGEAFTSISPEGIITILPVPTVETDVMEQPAEEAEPEMPSEEEEEVIEPVKEEPEEEASESKVNERSWRVSFTDGHGEEDSSVVRASSALDAETKTLMYHPEYDIKGTVEVEEKYDPEGTEEEEVEEKCKDKKKVKEQEVMAPDKDVEIPSKIIPVEKDLNDKIVPGNVLRDKDENYWVVKDSNVTGLSVETTGGGVGVKPLIPWEEVEGHGFVKVQEVKVNETVFVIDDPDPKLVELLKSGADGGEGEFDKFLPADLEKEVEDRDATFMPSLMPDGKRVTWSEVSGGSPKESKSISSTAKEMIDLKIQEASTRAERDKAFEVIEQLEGNSLLEVKILVKKLKGIMSKDERIIDILRKKIEEKSKIIKQAKVQLSEMKTIVDKDMNELKESNRLLTGGHKEAVVQLEDKFSKEIVTLNESIASVKEKHVEETKRLEVKSNKKITEEVEKARKEVSENVTKEFVEQFVQFRLAETGLTVDENSRALLEGCTTLDQVDDILEELRDIGRRNALHSKTIDEVVVTVTKPVDPDQADVDEKVSAVFEGFGYKIVKGTNDD